MLCVGHHLKEGIHILLDHLEDFFDDMERTLKDTSDEHLHPYLNPLRATRRSIDVRLKIFFLPSTSTSTSTSTHYEVSF